MADAQKNLCYDYIWLYQGTKKWPQPSKTFFSNLVEHVPLSSFFILTSVLPLMDVLRYVSHDLYNTRPGPDWLIYMSRHRTAKAWHFIQGIFPPHAQDWLWIHHDTDQEKVFTEHELKFNFKFCGFSFHICGHVVKHGSKLDVAGCSHGTCTPFIQSSSAANGFILAVYRCGFKWICFNFGK